MRYLTWAGLGLFFVANVALAGAAPPCNNTYQESPDAGNRFGLNPQNVSGGPYCGFSGTIGDTVENGNGGLIFEVVVLKDTVDAFRFSWAGGIFSLSVDFPSPSLLARELYADADRDNALLHAGDNWGLVSPGNYVFELTYLGSDPPFTIGAFTIPPNGNPIAAPLPAQETPEPGALALVLAGLAGLGTLRRRAKAA